MDEFFDLFFLVDVVGYGEFIDVVCYLLCGFFLKVYDDDFMSFVCGEMFVECFVDVVGIFGDDDVVIFDLYVCFFCLV